MAITDRDTNWIVDGIETDGLLGAFDATTPGESITLSFAFERPTDEPATGDASHIPRYESLKARLENAGALVTYRTPSNQIKYREQHTGESLLVKVEPGADTVGAVGCWGLIEGGEDKTTFPREWCEIDLDVIYLAPLSEFETKDDVATRFEASGL